MVRWFVERRLADVSARLRRAREELAVLDEQVAHLADDADELRLRFLVAETPLAEHEHRESQRHAEAMRRARAGVLARIDELRQEQDRLLDRLSQAGR